MKNFKKLMWLACLLFWPATGRSGTTFGVMHEFNALPVFSMPARGADGALYVTSSSGNGSVCRLGTDGTLTTLYNFSGGADGATPQAGLLLSGNVLYGTASAGANGYGTIFKINTDGSGFTVLYTFTGGDDGGKPLAALTLSGKTLFGTTEGDPDPVNYGSVFSIDLDGSGFQTLQTFWGTNGANPVGPLVVTNGVVYGTTPAGGPGSSLGTVFTVNTDGSAFTLICTFPERNSFNGPYYPNSSPGDTLCFSGNLLYGTAINQNDVGEVFTVNTDGTGFSVPFTYYGPQFSLSGLVLSGTNLYGLAQYRSTFPIRTLFTVGTNGAGFNEVYGGYEPNQDLTDFIITNGVIYGAQSSTFLSGIYRVDLNGNNATNLYLATQDLQTSSTELVVSNGVLYSAGFQIHLDGSSYTNSPNPWLGEPSIGNTLFGVSATGGANNAGTIFKMNANGTGYVLLHDFVPSTDGNGPSPLLLLGNALYGVAAVGGTNDVVFSSGDGTLFRINPNGSGFTVLHDFDYFDDGDFPQGPLVLLGGQLYGTTMYGGTYGGGTLFAINPDGTGFETIHAFADNNDGAEPNPTLIVYSNILYGMTDPNDFGPGGATTAGTIFRLNPGDNDITTLYTFPLPGAYTGANGLTNDDGIDPSSLIITSNAIYGTTFEGGVDGGGTVFTMNTDGTGFTTLHTFIFGVNGGGGPEGSDPNNLALWANTLYGTTAYGGIGKVGSIGNSGPLGAGTVFALSLGPIPLQTVGKTDGMVLSWGNPGFLLQSAANPSGPWTNMPAMQSPSKVNFTSPQQFFRLANTNSP